jgi:hypothetical protein
MSEPVPTFPKLTEHVAFAGRTGSGKTWGVMDMLSRRVGPTKVSKGRPFPWVIIDPKRDDNLVKIPHEKLSPTARILPDSGVHIVRPKLDGSQKQDVEDLLVRIFEKKVCGVYMDEGHLHGLSKAIRMFLVAGRARYCPVIWTSQRASQIDPFIWSQATYYRCFAIQGPNDHKRFYENFGFKYTEPDKYYSYYYDGELGETFYLKPASPIDETLERFNAQLVKRFNHI